MSKKYFKLPPTFEAEQFDGSRESAERIDSLAHSHDHYSNYINWGEDTRSHYVTVYREDDYGRKNEKRVSIYTGDWFVIRDDGKYEVVSEWDFENKYGEIDGTS